MKPVARRDGLIWQDVGEETLVYDETENLACSLNALAVAVWRCCDGDHTVEQIAGIVASAIELPEEVDVLDTVHEALTELDGHRLISGYTAPESVTGPGGIERREALRTMAGFALFPAITGIAAPAIQLGLSPAPTTTASASSFPVSATPSPTSSSIAVTPTATPSNSATPSTTPSNSATPTNSPTPTTTPSNSQTPSTTPTSSPTPSVTPSQSPT